MTNPTKYGLIGAVGGGLLTYLAFYLMTPKSEDAAS